MKSTRLFCFVTIAILIFAAFLFIPIVSATDLDEDVGRRLDEDDDVVVDVLLDNTECEIEIGNM